MTRKVHPVFGDIAARLGVLGAVVALAAAPVGAQTSTPGPAVDVEIVNPANGSNAFCVTPGGSLTARLFLRPGTTTTSCTPACGSPVNGGEAHLASALVDIAFDTSRLGLVATFDNPATAAVDGLPQDHGADGRIGWALAGDWTPDGDVNGSLADACDMQLLDTADWAMAVQFSALPATSGSTVLHLRRATDPDPFPLSFADLCGSEAMTVANGGIDEVVDGALLITDDCAGLLFFDGFESNDSGRWSAGT